MAGRYINGVWVDDEEQQPGEEFAGTYDPEAMEFTPANDGTAPITYNVGPDPLDADPDKAATAADAKVATVLASRMSGGRVTNPGNEYKDFYREAREEASQRALAAQTSFRNSDLSGGKDEEVESHVAKAILAFAPIVAGYMLGGNELGAYGAQVGVKAVGQMENDKKEREKERRGRALEDRKFALDEYQSANKDLRDISMKEADMAARRENMLLAAETQVDVAGRAAQARSQAGRPSEYGAPNRGSVGIVSPEVLEERARYFEGIGAAGKAAEIRAAIASGDRITYGQFNYGPWAPPQRGSSAATVGSVAGTAATIGPVKAAVGALRKAVNDFSVQDKNPLQILGKKAEAFASSTSDAYTPIRNYLTGENQTNLSYVGSQIRPIAMAVAKSLYGSSQQSAVEGERVMSLFVRPEAYTSGSVLYMLYNTINQGIVDGSARIRAEGAKEGQAEALQQLKEMKAELDFMIQEDASLRIPMLQGGTIGDAFQKQNSGPMAGGMSENKRRLLAEAMK